MRIIISFVQLILIPCFASGEFWKTGDGVGGTDVTADGWAVNREDCMYLCIKKKKNSPRFSSVNGVTFGVIDGKWAGECYCETGMSGSNGNTNWVSKLLPAICTGYFSNDKSKAGNGLERPPPNTPCKGGCIFESGRWGNSYCKIADGNWGAECMPCKEKEQEGACSKPPCKINGGWGRWSPITSCSKPCGGGKMPRFRLCNSPRPQNGGKECEGGMRQTKNWDCNAHKCPIDGGWGVWTDRGVCRSSCGGVVTRRTRLCDSPPPQYGGMECLGLTMQCCNRGPPLPSDVFPCNLIRKCEE